MNQYLRELKTKKLHENFISMMLKRMLERNFQKRIGLQCTDIGLLQWWKDETQ